MIREKFNPIQELQKKNEELRGKKRLSMVGQGDFSGANNVMRTTMNIKHHTQHLTIDNPEFPFLYDGKENITGELSSFYSKTDKEYEVVGICKKYDELLKGKVYQALYFLHCKEDDSYIVEERKEVESLTENFGFEYKNEYLDNCEVGDIIPPNTMLKSSTSYDEYGNVSIGVNGRILQAVHPAVQDDAIIVSKSFAKRMVTNEVNQITIPFNKNSILLNLYGEDGEYQGLPNIGDTITSGIVAATRGIKPTRMFSDMRDSALRNINIQSDQVFYGEGKVIDINIYVNNKELKNNRVTKQILQYYNDARWFYTEVYKICNKIINSGSKNIDEEIRRWKRLAMNYLDTEAIWAFNDTVFNDVMIEILIAKKEPAKVGRKIVGRHGNKTVICSVWDDEDMPYLTTDMTVDQYGVKHPKGPAERVELITNPLATVNRTIPLVIIEGSITFILDRTRKHAATLETMEEKKDFIFEIISILNPKQGKELEDIYNSLSDYKKKKFIEDCISLTPDGLIDTSNGLYTRYEVFNDEWILRDCIAKIYEKYPEIYKPYHIFMPKKQWGRDIYIGDDYVGYQYIMTLKQSGKKGFSVRSSGAISDESLPEKSNSNKQAKAWKSEKPIRFGEYESPNFMIITAPEDFALVSALYRSSVDGRHFMYEAVLQEDYEYNIPDSFTSRTADILQVYLKSLGVRMETIIDEDEYIGEPEHYDDNIGFEVGNTMIFCSTDEMYYLKKLQKTYHRFLKDNPGGIYDIDDTWDYILEHLPFKKKYLTDNIITLFKDNIEDFSIL